MVKFCHSCVSVGSKINRDTHWREEEVSQKRQKKADQVDYVWRMKKHVFSRGDWYPPVKKGKQAQHKEATLERTKQKK